MAKHDAVAKSGAGAALRPLLSVEELSAVLQVPVKTLYQWRFRGEGPKPIRVGRYLRYDPTDVATWVEARKAATAR